MESPAWCGAVGAACPWSGVAALRRCGGGGAAMRRGASYSKIVGVGRVVRGVDQDVASAAISFGKVRV
jgi:hypothetical protein